MKTTLHTAAGPIAAMDTLGLIGEQPVVATVLFVPGYNGSKEDFLPLLRPLAEAGIRSVSIDMRGQYESGWADSEAGYRISALAADVTELAERLATDGCPLHLVGHSFGGLVTRAAVLNKPELFDSFTLMGSGPAAISGPRLTAMVAAEPILAQHGLEALWEHIALLSQADPKFRKSPPALLAFLRERFLANDPLGLRVMGDELRSADDRTEDLSRVELPILVLHGADDDAWTPAIQTDMARRLGAEHRVIADAAHSPAVENPASTLSALTWFWEHRPGRS
jgi:pimeloyl-ACP methyl ester carboxylesterase